MKDIIQNQNIFYISAKSVAKPAINTNSESLKSDEVNDITVGLKSILSIKFLSRVMHFHVKKFLLKSLKTTLTLNLNSDLKTVNQKAQSIISL